MEAAVKAGAPEGLVGCIEKPTVALSQALMTHPDIALILATGGPGMVKAAYSSGKPAIGVGSGNTPVVIDETADIEMAVSSVLLSKTFDNGLICASEQAVIVCGEVYDKVKKELELRGAHIVNAQQRKKLAETIVIDGKLNTNIVGQSATKIAEMAGFRVDPAARVLIAEAEVIGESEPFSRENSLLYWLCSRQIILMMQLIRLFRWYITAVWDIPLSFILNHLMMKELQSLGG